MVKVMVWEDINLQHQMIHLKFEVVVRMTTLNKEHFWEAMQILDIFFYFVYFALFD